MPKNLSFIGAGEMFLAPKGTNQFVSVLNLSSLKITPQTQDKQLINTMSVQGGVVDAYTDVQGVEIALGGISQYSKDNLALLVKGTTSSVAGGSVTAEEIKGYAGKLIPTAKLIDTAQPVTVKKAAAVIAAAGYVVTPAGIRFLAAAAGFADGDALTVDYTALAAERIDALTAPSSEYECLFVGLNKADGGAPVVVRGYRLRLGAGALDLLSEGNDFAKSDLTGSLLCDTSKTGVGLSQYFDVRRG